MTQLPVLQKKGGSDNDRRAIAAELSAMDVGQVRFDSHSRALYSTDASLYQVEPIGVVIPRHIDAVQKVIEFCAARNLAILPRGGGSSLAGQCTNRAVVIDMSPLTRMISVDAAARRCVVEPGISIDAVNRLLAEQRTGLFFAPDPASMAQASIGGCIGNNAAGARSVRYGRTSENLLGVDVILASGQRVSLGANQPSGKQLAAHVCAVVRECQSEIRSRFPRTIRRNAGYGLDLILKQLDAGIADEDVDLTGLICGSEGTLAVIASATLKLHPSPKARGLAIASFQSVEAAIEAVQTILATGPSAVELLDDVVLEAALNNIEARHYVELLPKMNGQLPRAALYIEYQAQDHADELAGQFDAMRKVIPQASIAIYRDAAEMLKAWTLRKSGEALLHALSSTRRPVTFVEDNAIPVENLSRFVAEFKKIVARHGTTAAYYAHASVGVLHVRPMLNLHDAGDRELMQKIAVEVADLARDCGGVMSGEHGDGRVRGPLLDRFYGARIMQAFGKIKTIFDPQNLLNPGMIVDAGPMENITHNLRDSLGHLDHISTFHDYSDQHDFGGALEMCNGAGFCRKTAGGTMCPSYRVTLDERHSTRGRANALRIAIGKKQPEWNDPATIETLDLCLSCKACKSECPSSVDLSRLKSEYTAQRYAASGKVPLSAKFFGNIRAINRIASLAPGLANSLNRFGPVRAMINRMLGLAPKRSLPQMHKSLLQWFGQQRVAEPGGQRVVLFGDCFTLYNEPDIGKSAVSVLRTLGYRPEISNAGCCGRTMISSGLLPSAIATIDRTLANLKRQILDPNVKAIVVCEPSCLSAMKDDWLTLKLKTERSLRQRLCDKAMLVEDFVEKFWNDHPSKPSPAAYDHDVILHGHCHQKSLWGDQTSAAPLRRFLGNRLTTLPSGCCGMAGSFGFTANHYDLSMKIGELSLFPPIRSAPTSIITAPGTSCRHQILDATGRHALHPIQLLAKILSNSD